MFPAVNREVQILVIESRRLPCILSMTVDTCSWKLGLCMVGMVPLLYLTDDNLCRIWCLLYYRWYGTRQIVGIATWAPKTGKYCCDQRSRVSGSITWHSVQLVENWLLTWFGFVALLNRFDGNHTCIRSVVVSRWYDTAAIYWRSLHVPPWADRSNYG